MKRTIFLLLLALGFSGGMAFAQSGCQTYCDSAWKACKSPCKSGEDGRLCKNQCAEDHEACLNGCRKQSRLDTGHNAFAFNSGDQSSAQSIQKYVLAARPLPLGR